MFPFFVRNSNHDYSIQRVKFGIPLIDVCSLHNDLPSLLLMMILKLNKEAPYKKDVFRAPGNQAKMKKLIQFLQNGRLINLEQYSVHTIASVLKKFLRKLPNGIFGQQNEQLLFNIINQNNNTNECQNNNNNNTNDEKYKQIQRIIYSLPIVTQHLLVLLFGTFRLIVDSRQSSMTSESLSISIAPSFFHSCIPDGNKFAKIEDVQRFKTASSIMKFVIDNFGIYNLFGQENYEYYSRMTGKIVNVEENWTFTFRYPSKNLVPTEACKSIENRWINNECRKWNIPEFKISEHTTNVDEKLFHHKDVKSIRECQTPMCSINIQSQDLQLMESTTNDDDDEDDDDDDDDDDIEHSQKQQQPQPIRSQSVENDPRISMSMEDNLVKYHNNRLTYSESPPPSSHYLTTAKTTTTMMMMITNHDDDELISKRHFEQYEQNPHQHHHQHYHHHPLISDLKNVNQYAESTKSLTFLPIVHERQTQRMKTRSEWFLKPRGDNCQSTICRSQNQLSSSTTTPTTTPITTTTTTSTTTTKGLIKKTSSKEKREKVLLRRSSSKKSNNDAAKLNDSNSNSNTNNNNQDGKNKNFIMMKKQITDNDCIERSQRQTTIKYQYKPPAK